MENHKQLKDEAAVKGDANKLRYDLIPPYALEELVRVYTYGSLKYSDHNWRKGMSWSRFFGALMRHAWKFWCGETYDKETGIHHMAHCAWNALALVEYTRFKLGLDDRLINKSE